MVLTPEIQHSDYEKCLKLADGSPILSRRADVNMDVVAAALPVTRLFRHVTATSVDDQPFEATPGCRALPCLIEAGEYSMAECYERVENVCLANGARELRRIAFQVLGHSNIRPGAITVNMIQHGNQHFIFQIDCMVEEHPGETGAKESRLSLVASVSRHPQMNSLIKADHQGLMKLKKAAEKVPDMDSLATIPDHYGFYDDKGKPSLYLAPYLEGYDELNSAYLPAPFGSDGPTSRHMTANGINQGRRTRPLSEDLAADVRVRIMMHHFVLALQTNTMMHSSLMAGDYMYNSGTGGLALHCYRDFNLANVPGSQFDPMLQLVFEIFKLSTFEPRIAALAHQIAITMLTTEEIPAFPVMDPETSHFTFEELEFGIAIESLLRGGKISKEDLNKVVVLLTGIQSIITQTSPDPTNPIYFKYIKRIRDAAILCLSVSQMAGGRA